jgi:DNA-binding PadR family transcriptional regulator
MNRRPPAEGDLGRANEPAVLILTSLASGPKHGYALAQDIAEFAGVNLGPGTLYGAITRLEERGFIEPAGEEHRRQPYQITDSGASALASAVAQMRAIASEGSARLGLRNAGAHNSRARSPLVNNSRPDGFGLGGTTGTVLGGAS